MFSTGDKIDSLTISGTVIDAKSSKPLSSVWIGLYKSNNDSVLYKEDPIYIVKAVRMVSFHSIIFLTSLIIYMQLMI